MAALILIRASFAEQVEENEDYLKLILDHVWPVSFFFSCKR